MSNEGKEKNMKGEECEEVARTTLTVTVTPFDRSGRHIQCEIGGPSTGEGRVDGGVIFLDEGHDFDITFDLQDGEEPGLEWATDPLWIQWDRCPRAQVVDAPFKQASKGSSKRSTVAVDASSRSGVLHYRMNFRLNGQSVYCDPIIIHD